MSKENTFKIVGTAVNKDGTMKMRFANDIVARIKILDKNGCTKIDLIELPKALTKLKAAEYFLANGNLTAGGKLTAAQSEIVSFKIAEKQRLKKREGMKATITKNVKGRIKNKAPTDPRVESFVESNTETAK